MAAASVGHGVGHPGARRFRQRPVAGSHGSDCALAAAPTQHCYGTAHGLGLNLSQTLWSFQAFSQLKEANFQAAAAEAGFRSAQQNLLLRVAQAYFAILSASDQLATNRAERDAFGTLLNQARTRQQTGVGPRSDVEQAQAFYDATEQSVIDAQNALDDANLAMTEIVGPHATPIAPMRQDIPMVSPEPASADEWVNTARRDNFDVKTAELKMEAAERDISAQRGRALPAFFLTGTSSKLTQEEVLGGNQTLDTVGVSFSWPLFQGGAVASAVRQSRALFRQAQATYDSAQRDAERQTRAAFRGIVTRHSAHRRCAPCSRFGSRRGGGEPPQCGIRHRHRVRPAERAEQLLHGGARLQPVALRLFDECADAQAAGRPFERTRSHRHR